MKPHSALWLLVSCVPVLSAGTASCQNYPNKPIRIVTSPIGGGNDFMARTISQGIAAPLGQPVIVENRSTNIIPVLVAQAPADGYTILFIGSGMWNQWLLKKTDYHPVKDFAPITIVDQSPNILIVTPSLGIKSVKDLIAAAKTKPGALNYAFGAFASSAQLAAELFKSMAGVNIVGVSYAGTGAQINALLSGEAQLTFASAPAVSQHLKSGRLTALAVTTAEASSMLPGLPTVAAAGLPGFEATSIDVMMAPAGTPQAAIKRLNQEIVRFLRQPEIKDKFLATGVEIVGSSPADLSATMNAEIKRMTKVVKDANLRIDK